MRDEYDVGEEIKGIWQSCIAARKLRDVAIKIPFGYKKALRASKDSEKYRKNFWEAIVKLYPTVDIYKYEYHYEKNVIQKTVEENKE